MDTGLDGLKFVVMGDERVGKTCMLVTYTEGKIPEYVPTKFETTEYLHELDGVFYKIRDSSGSEEFNHVRSTFHPDTDIFLICFAMNKPDSLSSVEPKYLKELDESPWNVKDVPRILIGLKDLPKDLYEEEELKKEKKREEEIIVKLQKEKALEIIEKEGNRIYGFFECSLQNVDEIEEVFSRAIEAALEKKSLDYRITMKKMRERKKCIIM